MSEISERAHQASRLLDDPTLQKAFEGVRQSMLAALEAASVGDRETHHEIALSLQALKAVKRQLERWVQDGEVEKARSNV